MRSSISENISSRSVGKAETEEQVEEEEKQEKGQSTRAG